MNEQNVKIVNFDNDELLLIQIFILITSKNDNLMQPSFLAQKLHGHPQYKNITDKEFIQMSVKEVDKFYDKKPQIRIYGLKSKNLKIDFNNEAQYLTYQLAKFSNQDIYFQSTLNPECDDKMYERLDKVITQRKLNEIKEYLVDWVEQFSKDIQSLNLLSNSENKIIEIPNQDIQGFFYEYIDAIDFYPKQLCYLCSIPDYFVEQDIMDIFQSQNLELPIDIITNPYEDKCIRRLQFQNEEFVKNLILRKGEQIYIQVNGNKMKEKRVLILPCSSREDYRNLIIKYQVLLKSQEYSIQNYNIEDIHRNLSLSGSVVDINYTVSKDIWCITFTSRDAVEAAIQFNKCFFISNNVFKYEPVQKPYPLKGTIFPPKLYSGSYERDPYNPRFYTKAQKPYRTVKNFQISKFELEKRSDLYKKYLELVNKHNENEQQLKNQSNIQLDINYNTSQNVSKVPLYQDSSNQQLSSFLYEETVKSIQNTDIEIIEADNQIIIIDSGSKEIQKKKMQFSLDDLDNQYTIPNIQKEDPKEERLLNLVKKISKQQKEKTLPESNLEKQYNQIVQKYKNLTISTPDKNQMKPKQNRNKTKKIQENKKIQKKEEQMLKKKKNKIQKPPISDENIFKKVIQNTGQLKDIKVKQHNFYDLTQIDSDNKFNKNTNLHQFSFHPLLKECIVYQIEFVQSTNSDNQKKE